MAVVASRCGPTFKTNAARRAQPARPAVLPFVRFARPALLTRPRAFPRNAAWDDGADKAMKDFLNDMSKQWQQHQQRGGMGGAVFWPGGGYMYGPDGRCRSWGQAQQQQQQQQQQQGTSATPGFTPELTLDLVDNENFYLVYADVPGLSKSDLIIKLSKDKVLSISGERKQPVEEGYKQKERRFGAFERKWTLPEDADSEGISAKVTEGVLTITVPKKQPEPVVDDSQDIFIA